MNTNRKPDILCAIQTGALCVKYSIKTLLNIQKPKKKTQKNKKTKNTH